jgi:hemoglobin/transferrin/lactoferrin receptor protein
VFVQSSRHVHPRLLVSGGLRGDYVQSVNHGGFFGDRSIGHGAAAGFIALTAGPFERVTFTAQVARGFRDPTLSDRFYRGPSGRGFITGNPDLRPETSRQFDLGARYATDRVRVAVYGYHYRITDLVERFQADPDFFFFRNRGRAAVTGVELEAQAFLGRGFALEASAQRGRGRAHDDDAALDDISPDTVFATVRKTFGRDVSAFIRAGRYASDMRPGPSEIPAPGHTNVDVGGTWTASPRLEIRGAIRNLLDESYYASPDPRFVLAPGINGFVTIRVRF